MITKFLYQMDERNKRVITGVVQNNEILPYDPLYEYPMVLETSYQKEPNEAILDNFGPQFYAVCTDDKSFKYLNFNDYMLKVKLALTENVAFAATLSKNLLSVILEETGYFDEDNLDVNYVDSGLFLTKNLEYKDYYDGWFKKVTDDVYVQLNYLSNPLFVGKENNEYILTDDFKKAFRVSKKECRHLLIAREFIDRDVLKRNVCFSHYNMFLCNEGYAFGGLNSFSVTYEDAILRINRDFEMSTDYRLVGDEKRAAILRDMMYLMKKPDEGKKAYLKINGRYVKSLGNDAYELTSEAAKASSLDFKMIDILKKAISLFTDNPAFEILRDKNYFLYTHLNSYELSKEIKEAIPSKLIKKEIYEEFIEAFNDNSNQNLIISYDNKYVSFEVLSNLEFKISYELTGFNATRFNENQVKVLSELLNIAFNKREILPIFNAAEIYNIKATDAFYTLEEAYDNFLHTLKESNIRVSNIAVKDIKTESDKGAIEYLRRFYLKTIYDSYNIFKSILAFNDVSNILLCGTTSTADIIGLSVAAHELNKKVNVTTLETPKWGLYPSAYISKNVNYISSYRLALTALDKNMLAQFDLIYIGKNFKDDAKTVVKFIRNLFNLDKDMIIINTHLTKNFEIPNNYFKALAAIKEVTRKFINNESQIAKNIKFDNSSIIDKKSTYYSAIKIEKNMLIDLIKKN